MTRTWLQLARHGDILNILPLLHADFKSTGQRQRLMVAAEYASLLEGCSYIEPVIYEGPYFEIEKAVRIAEKSGGVVVSQINGPRQTVIEQTYRNANIPEGTTAESFDKESWRAAGRLGEWMKNLPLVFDRRDAKREEALLRSHDLIKRGKSKPLILISIEGNSSPFPYKDLLREMVKSRFGKTHRILELPKAERLYDLLAIYEKAALLIASDSAPLHLALACQKLPVFALVNDKPSLWHGSSWRPNHAWYCRYHDWPERAGEMMDFVEHISEYSQDSSLMVVWSAYETKQFVSFDWRGFPVMLGMCARDSLSSMQDNKRVPYLHDVLRLARQRAYGDDTLIMLTRPGIKIDFKEFINHAPFFSYRMHEGKFSPIADVFCASRKWWRDAMSEIPDLLLSSDYYWSECLRAVFQRAGAKDVTGICSRETPKTPPEPKQLSKTLTHNINLCNQYMLERGVHGRYPKVSEQLESIRINVSMLPAFAYNPSIFRNGDKLVMTYRHHAFGDHRTRLGIADLNKDFTISKCQDLQVEGTSTEDARMFSLHAEPWMSWVESTWDGKQSAKSIVKYGMLKPDYTVDRVFCPPVGSNDGTSNQKNWCFFESDDNLFCIYRSHDVHTVLQLKGEHTVHEFKSTELKWPYGQIRGGNVVPFDGQLLRFFHSSLRNEISEPRHRYYVGACVIRNKPPFDVLRVSKKPILYGSEMDILDADQRKVCFHRKRNVAFPCGAIQHEGGFLLSLGANDCSVVLSKVGVNDLHL